MNEKLLEQLREQEKKLAIKMTSIKLIPLKKASEMLGISYHTIYRWVKNGRIKALKLRGRNGNVIYRIPEAQLYRLAFMINELEGYEKVKIENPEENGEVMSETNPS